MARGHACPSHLPFLRESVTSPANQKPLPFDEVLHQHPSTRCPRSSGHPSPCPVDLEGAQGPNRHPPRGLHPQIMQLLTRGNRQRTQEPTAANRTSSRSHAVLQVTVRRQGCGHHLAEGVRVGRLFLVDLAGSERASQVPPPCPPAAPSIPHRPSACHLPFSP